MTIASIGANTTIEEWKDITNLVVGEVNGFPAISSFMTTLLDDTSAVSARVTLGIPTISTFMVSVLDDTTANSARTTLGIPTISSFMEGLLDDANATQARNTLGFPNISDFAFTLFDDANASAMRSTLEIPAMGSFGATLFGANTASAAITSLGLPQASDIQGKPNLLINAFCNVNQRVATAANNDNYAHDRWNVLTQSNTVSVATATKNSLNYGLKLTQPNVTSQRLGMMQIIDYRDAIALRGKSLTLSGECITNSAFPIHYAILEWSGSEDAVTSDIILNWDNAAYTVGQFFNAANLAVKGVATSNTSSSWGNITDLQVTLGTTFKNLIVFAWSTNKLPVNDNMSLLLKLEEGNKTQINTPRFSEELEKCLRFYEKTYDYTVAPGSVAYNSSIVGSLADNILRFYYTKRKVRTPSVTCFSSL